MDSERFLQWLKEPRAIQELPGNQRRTLFVDNCSGHKSNFRVQQVMQCINTDLRYLPANATHLYQPLDSFLIQKFKEVRRSKWDKQKILLREQKSLSQASGKVKHPNRRWYKQTAIDCVAHFNGLKYSTGI